MMNRVERLLKEHNNYEHARALVEVEGLSTPRVCNLLNDLVASLKEDEVYLEIGTWKGLTVCSAIKDNPGKRVVACDKFRVWGKWTGWGFVAKRTLLANIRTYSQKGADVTFHHMTSRQLFERQLVPPNVKVYFYDGDHTYAGTKHGVVAAAPYLCEESWLLMDDWNDPEIQRATFDGFKEAGLEVQWKVELEGRNGDPNGWWNGLGVFKLKRPRT